MNRRTILALVAVISVLSATTGWVAGQRIKSPADVAAETEPPTASLITVPVEERELSTSVVIRGQVEFDDAAEIPVNPTADGTTIITNVPKAVGDQLLEGDIAIEVAGRPLFVLEGSLPVFRPLGPGVEGRDVRQLEEALARLGYSPGTVDEVYDNDTESAVGAFYRASGYSPDDATAEEIAQIAAARQRVQQAEETLRTVRNNAGGTIPESVRLSLDQSVNAAAQQLDDATQLRTTTVAAATAERDAAAAAQTAARAAAELAIARVDQAEAGTDPDTGEPPTFESLAKVRAERQEANSQLAAANARSAEAAAALADAQKMHDRAVNEATTGLAIARASRSEQLASYAAGPEEAEQITSAARELTDATEALDQLDAAIGISFPSNELLFLPQLPRTVQRVNVETGDIPQGSAMTVTGSGVIIRSSVSAADRSLLTVGVEALMEDDVLGLSIPVRVSFVADVTGGPNAGSDRYSVRLEPLEEVPEEAYDQNLRVTVPFESTDGAVLAVPLAALSAGADGTSRVQVERSNGAVETVSVRTGLLARSLGLVEIDPIDGGLVAGDRVVVGRDSTSAPADSGEADATNEDDRGTDG